MPPVAEFVARIIKKSIVEKSKKNDDHQVIDLRKAPTQESLL